MRLSPATRLVIRIGSGLLVAGVIAVALTVPAPASSEEVKTIPAITGGFGSAGQCGVDSTMVRPIRPSNVRDISLVRFPEASEPASPTPVLLTSAT